MLLFIGGPEIAVIILFVLILFGSKKIPDFARMMGKGMREFRRATDEIKRN
jgi:sec-independent protein translocase protein TatA